MMPQVVKQEEGRALLAGVTLGSLLILGAGVAQSMRVHEPAPPPSPSPASWTGSCEQRLQEARMQLDRYSGEFRQAEVRTLGARRWARVELTLPPQYSARIEYRLGADESPAVFDWEETPTPVVGSFALHRHVGAFDLSVVADDSDERGLRFAALMQPLLDGCLMDAR